MNIYSTVWTSVWSKFFDVVPNTAWRRAELSRYITERTFSNSDVNIPAWSIICDEIQEVQVEVSDGDL